MSSPIPKFSPTRDSREVLVFDSDAELSRRLCHQPGRPETVTAGVRIAVALLD